MFDLGDLVLVKAQPEAEGVYTCYQSGRQVYMIIMSTGRSRSFFVISFNFRCLLLIYVLACCSFEIITTRFFADFSGFIGDFRKVFSRPIFNSNLPQMNLRCGHFSYQKFRSNCLYLLGAFFLKKKENANKKDKETKT